MKKNNIENPPEPSEERDFSEFFKDNEWELPTDFGVIDPAHDAMHERLIAQGWEEEEAFHVSLGLREAIVNAIVHGNLEIEASEDQDTNWSDKIHKKLKESPTGKKIRVKISFPKQDEVEVRVRDEGKGFDHKTVLDPTHGEGLEKTIGRGLAVMQNYFDTVEFDHDGSEVILKKKMAKE